jgi:hypothetical protein
MLRIEANSPLTKNEAVELLQIALNTYHEQAALCSGAGASLASCVMVGATVEAILTAVTCLFFEDALQTGEVPKYKNGKTKPLDKWQFTDLLAIAKAAKWLPDELDLEERLDLRAVKNPVRTDTIREVRNLVHPVRYGG